MRGFILVHRVSHSLWFVRPLCLLVAISCAPVAAWALEGEHNKDAALCQSVAGAAYTAAVATSLFTLPPTDQLGDRWAYATNLGLKLCAPQLVAPASQYGVEPDTHNRCVHTYQQSTTEAEYQNILGVQIKIGYPKTWGALGTPEVFHYNTDVGIRLLGHEDSDGAIQLPVGRNTLVWRADTKLSLMDFVPFHIPKLPSGTKALKSLVKSNKPMRDVAKYGYELYAERFAGNAAEYLVEEGVAYSLDAAIGLSVTQSQLGIFDDVYTTDTQSIWVYDRTAPVIDTNTNNSSFDATLAAILNYDDASQTYVLEAFQPGGVMASSALPVAEGLLSYSDACDTKLSLGHSSVPEFWALGDEIEVTWTVSDPGPVRPPVLVDGVPQDDGGHNTAQVTQRFVVQDTNPPIVLAPPSKVIEVPSGTLQTDVPLGNPRVFDLVDLDAEVVPDRGDTLFDLGLTEVTWTATDDGGNSSQAVQLINVKEEGTNSIPVADNQTLAATSFKTMDIILTGTDADYHPSVDRFDPLTFSIVEPPQNGFFIAPLLPFFIEDFRLEASTMNYVYTPRYSGITEEERWGSLQADPATACAEDLDTFPSPLYPWDLEYPYQPEWMTVDDAGFTYVYDNGQVRCDPSNYEKYYPRLVVFGPDGEFVRSRSMSSSIDDFSVDNFTGRLLTLDRRGAWDNYVNAFVRNEENFGVPEGETPAGLRVRDMQYAESFVQDHQGVLYVQGSPNIIRAYRPDWGVYGTSQDDADVFLGQLADVPRDPGAFDITVDSQNNLYMIHGSRILKFSAGHFDDQGQFITPQLIGWLGRCIGNKTDKVACDVKQQRSIGFSCTDDLCERDLVGLNGLADAGQDPGQFKGISKIVFDPNDILYVADAGNKRIQRFTPNGYFAGQAKAQGQGYGFILGDFSGFDTITVNSDHFYILQKKDPLGGDSGLLHVFKTTPITPIDDSSAKVTYQSSNNFQGTDEFVFAVTDGLDSGEATVSINVERDYRPPTIPHPPGHQTVGEDSSIVITLTGSDPDDFLDVLSYELVSSPAHGEVSVIGNRLTYIPDENFAGEDHFSYRVYDGVYYSEPESVELTVTPTPDQPLVTLEAPEVAGTGFYMSLEVSVFDPDEGADHHITIDWGDGSSEQDGTFLVNGVETDTPGFNEDGTMADDIETTGPIYSRSSNGYGNLAANHAYTRAGHYTIYVCATDKVPTALPSGCNQLNVSVEPRVAYRLSSEVSSEQVNPGDTVDINFTLQNLPFDVTPEDINTGLDDSNVVVTGVATEGLEALRSSQSGCTFTTDSYRCELGDMPYNSSKVITLRVDVDDLAPGMALLSLNAELSGTVPLHEVVAGAAQVQVIPSDDAPQLSSITPDMGDSTTGTKVTLYGSDFQAGAAVRFGNRFATVVDVINSNTITALTPVQPDGIVDVEVVNPDERSDTLTQSFTYRTATTGGGSPDNDGDNTNTGGGSNGGNNNSGGSKGGGGGSFDPLLLMFMMIGIMVFRRHGYKVA